MTDEELIAQLEQGALEDLSPAVVDLIQSRLAQSAPVRTALVERLYVEQYLAGAIGADNMSRDDVLARAARLRPPRTLSKRAIAVWITSLALASVALVFAARPFLAHKSPEATARANRQVTPSPAPQSAVKEADATELGPSPRPEDERRAPPPSSTNSGEAATDDGAKAPPKPEPPSDSPPRPLADVMFEDIGLRGAAPRESELRRWFTAASGQAHRFTERMVRDRRCGFFDGWIKLREAWPADGMLRLALTDHNRLRLHFYHGGRGVTFTYFEGPTHTWSAYAVSRAAGEILPQNPILVATDEGRGFRSSPTGAGPIDITWREGELRMSRGDVRLLTAPMAGLPEEVYFEGHAGFRGLAMVRVEDVLRRAQPVTRAQSEPEHPVTGDFAAAKEKWRVETPTGALFTRNDDGSVELAVAKTTSPAWVSWKLPRRELCEIILELDEATPGSGVYVSDEQGRPQDIVRFFRDSRTGQTTIAIAGAADTHSEQVSDPNTGPIPFVLPRSWLKLVVGCGILRVWAGPDGRHWAPAVTTTQNVPAPFATLGLYCKASESRRAIRLRRIEIRELAGLTRLVEDTVRARAAAIQSAGDFADWLKQVDSRRPTDIDSDKWRRASALATLGHGANPGLGMALLATLLDDVQAGPWPVEARLAALNDAALVANTWDNHADALLFLARYRRLGQQAFESGESRPYSLIRPAQMQSPLASRQGVPATASSLARFEILQTMSDGRWEELEHLFRTVNFWKPPSMTDRRDGLADWAESVAAAKLSSRSRQTSGRPERVPRSRVTSATAIPAWRHPLDEQISPEMFNLMAEFNAALETKDYRDAAGTIASATDKLVGDGAMDLLTDPRDEQLLVPLSSAVKLAMSDHPPLASAMNEHYGPIARQRVQRAISEGDEAVLQAAIVQFQGTGAASMAHAWLGGEALALGEFARAFSHFEMAQANAEAADRIEIAARARLAAAGFGREFGSPVTANVTFGGTELTAGEFEGLVQQMRGGADVKTDSKSALAETIPGASTFRLEKRGEFDAGAVYHAGSDVAADAAPAVDWFARQTIFTANGNRIFVTSPHAVSAFDSENGSQKWNSRPADNAPRAAGFIAGAPIAPARPLFVGDRIIVRRQTRTVPALVAIDREGGQTLWQSRLAAQESVVSDPVAIGSDILALVAPREERQIATTLALVAFDASSGEVRWRRPLVRLRDSWWSQPMCEVAVDGDTLFAALGGATLACDTAGRVKWLRRAERVPAAVDGWSLLQAHDRPIIARLAQTTPIEDSGRAMRLVVAQRGVRTLECLDPATGRKHWGRVLPDLVSLVGVPGNVVVAHVGRALLGLDLESGKTVWRYEIGDGAVVGCNSAQGVLVTRRENDRLTLVWLDAKTGREIGRTVPEGQSDRAMDMGPVLADPAGRGWALISRDPKSTKRELCELIRIGPASPAVNESHESVWTRRARQ